jgi:hypothetical protein
MPFTSADILNLIALFISMAGSFLMYFYSPNVSSQTIIYRKVEMERINKRDAHKNKMLRRGMLLLFIGFIIQAAAIFLSVASK